MNELSNTASALGNYNDIPTSITSNTSVVNIVEGLTLSKFADKTNWADGELEYTLTITNKTDKTYVKPVVTDTIDTNLVTFVDGSVTIDDVAATSSEYSYNDGTNTLTINLGDILPSGNSTIKFQVEKKN